METPNHQKKSTDKTLPMISAVLDDGAIVEMVYRAEEGRTLFCIAKDGNVQELDRLDMRGQTFVPYSPRNNLLAHEVVLFPSAAVEYGTTEELAAEVREFIHAFVDVSPLFEEVASYYVLFSWVYDSFNELPYLRIRGDTGSGKTRSLLTIGSVCYLPIFASGASTVSPIFRILDSFRGTLVVDEADFRYSDEQSEMIKIMNNGNARGFPVLRSEAKDNKEFDPKAFTVFGPKIIATRKHFEDRALETRCLTEETGGRKLREDIPLNLGAEWKERAQALRNKLLMFRFRNFGRRTIDSSLIDRTVEPRLAQLFAPLLSVIDKPSAKEGLLGLIRQYHQNLVVERSADTEAQVLEIVRDLLAAAAERPVSVRDVTGLFSERFGEDHERKITPKWIGGIIRRTLQLQTYKSHGVFVLATNQGSRLEQLYEKYGVPQAPEPVGLWAGSN